MSKVRVQLWGKPQGYATVDPAATEGATLGVNLFWPNGTLVVPDDLAPTTGGDAGDGQPSGDPSLWELIVNVPANVTALQNAAGTGLFVVTGAGTGALRSIAGTAGQIDVANGDAVAGPPTLSLADVADSGTGTLQKTAFDAKGRKTGTAAATTDDLAEGTANLYHTPERAAAAAPVQSVNGQIGAVEISASDVGADPAGSAAAALSAAQDYADGKVADSIADGVTDKAPSQNAVYDALAGKAPLTRPQFTDWVGIGVEADRPVRISTATNTLPPGSASFLIEGDLNRERLEMRGAGWSDPTFQSKRASGSISAPGATHYAMALGQLAASGHDGVDWVVGNRAIIRMLAAEDWTGAAQGTEILFMTTPVGTTSVTGKWGIKAAGEFVPSVDNAVSLGLASQRVSQVYAASGTINTSDAREKTKVASLTAAEAEAAAKLAGEIGSFQWIESVQEKGGDSARTHVGLTVQRAIAVMQAHGLDPFRYGFICFDEWDEQPEVWEEWGAQEEVRDEAGNVIQPAVEAGRELVKPHRPAGSRYGFRHDQLALFLLRGLAARQDALEARLAALEA